MSCALSKRHEHIDIISLMCKCKYALQVVTCATHVLCLPAVDALAQLGFSAVPEEIAVRQVTLIEGHGVASTSTAYGIRFSCGCRPLIPAQGSCCQASITKRCESGLHRLHTRICTRGLLTACLYMSRLGNTGAGPVVQQTACALYERTCRISISWSTSNCWIRMLNLSSCRHSQPRLGQVGHFAGNIHMRMSGFVQVCLGIRRRPTQT